MMSESLVTVKQLSSFLNLHPNTIYKLVEKGEIPFIKRKGVGVRFRKENIEVWLDQGSLKIHSFIESFSKVDLALDRYDKLFLGGERMSRKGKIWNYPFGSVYLRLTKTGKERWYIYYRVDGERIREAVKNAQSRADAFRGKHGFMKEVRRITFNEFADKYLEDYAIVNKKSWKTDEGYLKGMRDFFKGRFIDAITSQDIEQYKAARKKSGVKLTTVNKCLQILSKMFNLAVTWGYLKDNPVKGVKKYPEEPFRRKRVLSPAEEEKFFTAMVPRYLKSMVKIFLNTGLRRKELFQLTWENVDFRNRQIFVQQTKTSKSRYIPMNETVYQELKELFRNREGEGLVFVNSKTGKAFVDIRRAFYGACRRAGIKNLLLLDLRRTFATRLLQVGVDIVTVQHLLGHTSVTTTQIYTMTNKEEKRKAVSLLEELNWRNLSTYCPHEKRERKPIFTSYSFSIN